MANVVCSDQVFHSRRRGFGPLRRSLAGIGLWFEELSAEIRLARQDYRLSKDLEDLSWSQLRDIGVERDAC
ncbi:MAG: hypothetical protein R3245_01975 [Kiloniellales bacterium]|nr:hypothetical protein [Kiloniellales bacterium]